MAAVQLSFSLRTSANCKTVHLLGSWDNYVGQLPLSKDPAKAGGWKGTFRFQGATLHAGSRYWYYYIIDGYHVSHDPGKEHTIEPTTGRKLNILDVPSGGGSANTRTIAPSGIRSGKGRRHMSIDIPKGRSLSPSQIRSPHPYKPNLTRHLVNEQYTPAQLAQLAAQLSRTQIESSEEESSDSDSDSDVPSLTSSASRSSNSSSPSSVSSTSSCCTCERYGITRSGQRVKLDCGGKRCGYSDEGSSCSSDSDDGYRMGATRRQGIVVRG